MANRIDHHICDIVLGVLAQDPPLPRCDLHLNKALGICPQACHHEDPGVIGREPGDSREVRIHLVGSPGEESSPGGFDVIAHADLGRVVGVGHTGRPHPHPVVGIESGHIPGVFRVQLQGGGPEVKTI